MAQSDTSFWAKAKVRMHAKYTEDSEESVRGHELKKFVSSGAHWVPVIYFAAIFIGMWTCFILWYVYDRDFQTLCMDIYDKPERCSSDQEWTFPTISYTGQRTPEWYIFSVTLSLGGILQFFTVYFVHRRAWAAAIFDNKGSTNGTLETEPRVFCIPCCCCSSAFGCSNQYIRPKLKAMLKTTEILGYISSFFLFWVGWARMTYSYELHNLVAYTFFASGIFYMPLFTLAQHQIKKKCPAKFKAPWRYFAKVMVCGVLVVIGLAYVFVFLEMLNNTCNKWDTSMVRRTGLPVGEYLAAHFVGIYLLTHYEDIRQENWYFKKQVEDSMAKRAQLPRPLATSSAGYQDQTISGIAPDGVSTFAAPQTEI